MKYLSIPLLIHLFLIQPLVAQPVAAVYGVKGKALKNNEIELKINDSLNQSDLINTELESFLLLLLSNGYLIKIDEDLALKVEDILLIKAKKTDKSVKDQLNQLLGKKQESTLQLSTMETFAVTHSEEHARSSSLDKEEYLEKKKEAVRDESSDIVSSPAPAPAPALVEESAKESDEGSSLDLLSMPSGGGRGNHSSDLKVKPKSSIHQKNQQNIQKCIKDTLPKFEDSVESIPVSIFVKFKDRQANLIEKIYLSGGLETPTCILSNLAFFQKAKLEATSKPSTFKYDILINLRD